MTQHMCGTKWRLPLILSDSYLFLNDVIIDDNLYSGEYSVKWNAKNKKAVIYLCYIILR